MLDSSVVTSTMSISINGNHYQTPTILMDLDDAVSEINLTIHKRKQYRRKTVSEAIKAGRILRDHIKPRVRHGEWESFVVSHFTYRVARDAQLDMQLFEAFEPYLEDLLKTGVISPNALEDDILSDDIVEDETIDIAINAMHTLMRSADSERTVRLALDQIAKQKSLTTPQVKQLIDGAQSIDVLPVSDEVKEELTALVSEWNCYNPDVIHTLSEIRETNPETYQSVLSSGTIFVPGVNNGEGRIVEIAKASQTDIEIAIGREDVEAEISKQVELGNLVDDLKAKPEQPKNSVDNPFRFLRRIEGDKGKILEEITKLLSLPASNNLDIRVEIHTRPKK